VSHVICKKQYTTTDIPGGGRSVNLLYWTHPKGFEDHTVKHGAHIPKDTKLPKNVAKAFDIVDAYLEEYSKGNLKAELERKKLARAEGKKAAAKIKREKAKAAKKKSK